MRRALSLLGAFGRFWWEFLIGENPAAFVGALVVIAAALLLRHNGAAIAVIPALLLIFLLTSTYRARVRGQSS